MERIRALLDERELDALLVTDLVNVRWLSGFPTSNAAVVVTRDRAALVTDFRYIGRARRMVDGLDVVEGKRDLLGDIVALLPSGGVVGFEDQKVTVARHAALSEAAAGRSLVGVGDALLALRAVKTPAELASIADACSLADEALSAVLERGVVGMRESELAARLIFECRQRGAQRASFDPIVASASRTDAPHSEPTDAEIGRDELLMVDWGCELDGWCSDGTRMFATGSLPDEVHAVYEVVARAQQAGVDAVRAGVVAREVDSAARDVIAEAGYGDAFGHGLGHGVGMEVHEEPRLTQKSEHVLEPGNVVSVEPGIYLEGRFGMRVEDLVAVTEDGCTNFSHLSKELREIR